MRLGLIITARCNAACLHCSTSCGPDRDEQLTRERILALMDEAAGLSAGEPLRLSISGGEPFLDFALLREIVAHGARLGAEVTCVTNGYWAGNDDKARRMLAELKADGLALLAVSTSRYHRRYVKLPRVERVLAAARAVGLRCHLKHVRSGSAGDTANAQGPDGRGIPARALAAGADAVQEFPLLPHLRDGAALPDAAFPQRRRGLPRARCPAPYLTVREDGTAYTCCTPGAFAPLLALGSVHTETLETLRERALLGGLQQLLRAQGPAFLPEIRARGLTARLRGAYAGVCDLCTHIATDPQLAAAAAARAQRHEVQQLDRILASLTEADRAVP